MKQLLSYVNAQIDWAYETTQLEGIKPDGVNYWRGYAHAMKEIKREIEKQEQS